jgi:glycosyltransferase involved in cell wall biosynthesis
MDKKKFNILHTESSTGWAGQEMRIILEAREMKNLGHKIIMAVQPDSGIIPAIDREGFEKEILNMQKKNCVGSVIKLIRIIANYRVDIVNTHSSWDSWIASISARISRRKPLIIRTRHLSTPVSNGFLSRIVYQYLPHLIITTGKSIKETLVNTNRFPENKIISVPTGVDLDAFSPRGADSVLFSEVDVRSGEIIIGIIAALRSWKGHDYLFEAIRILLEKGRNVKLLIAGDGPRYNHLVDKAASIGIQDSVFFLGYRENIAEVFSICDIVVLSSYANEGVPQSLLQAMAMQKPVIACAAGSIPEIVLDKKTGILVEARNPDALARGISLMLDNTELTEKVAFNARKYVESNYSLSNMVEKIESIYNQLAR